MRHTPQIVPEWEKSKFEAKWGHYCCKTVLKASRVCFSLAPQDTSIIIRRFSVSLSSNELRTNSGGFNCSKDSTNICSIKELTGSPNFLISECFIQSTHGAGMIQEMCNMCVPVYENVNSWGTAGCMLERSPPSCRRPLQMSISGAGAGFVCARVHMCVCMGLTSSSWYAVWRLRNSIGCSIWMRRGSLVKEREPETEEAKMIPNMKTSDDDDGDDGLLFRRVSVVICQETRDRPIWVKVTEQGRGQKNPH